MASSVTFRTGRLYRKARARIHHPASITECRYVAQDHQMVAGCDIMAGV